MIRTAARVAVAAAALAASVAMAEAQADGCAILKISDVAVLLGPGTTAKAAGGTGCSWSSEDGKRKLIASRPGASTGIPGGTMFTNARAAAAKPPTAKVTDEAGIGDNAFAVLETFGIVLTVLKQDRILQIQYFSGAKGTTKDIDALRPVAKLAAAAF